MRDWDSRGAQGRGNVVQQAALVTHDIGNMVGYAFAAQHPERVKHYIAMDAPLPGIGPIATISMPEVIATTKGREGWLRFCSGTFLEWRDQRNRLCNDRPRYRVGLLNYRHGRGRRDLLCG